MDRLRVLSGQNDGDRSSQRHPLELLAGERMDSMGGTDRHRALHNGSMRQELRQRGVRILHYLHQSTNLGHSLAEVPCHQNVLVVVQGSLCHSPDSLLRGPRLKVLPAQGADVREKQVDDGSIARWLCACESGLET